MLREIEKRGQRQKAGHDPRGDGRNGRPSLSDFGIAGPQSSGSKAREDFERPAVFEPEPTWYELLFVLVVAIAGLFLFAFDRVRAVFRRGKSR
jgi:hypothetical protein